jgi:hypothetical protein
MTTVFLSGSRKISRLNEEVRRRLEKMVENCLMIVTGDANGADKAMQAYLAEREYKNVTIYYVGDAPRNNVGHWATKNVVGDQKLSGRDFYAQKDKEMSMIADYGFVLWDGKSLGSVQNMFWLLSEGKTVVVYVTSTKQFFNFRTQDELVGLLSQSDDDTLDEMERKIGLPEGLNKANRRQATLDFHS